MTFCRKTVRLRMLIGVGSGARFLDLTHWMDAEGGGDAARHMFQGVVASMIRHSADDLEVRKYDNDIESLEGYAIAVLDTLPDQNRAEQAISTSSNTVQDAQSSRAFSWLILGI